MTIYAKAPDNIPRSNRVTPGRRYEVFKPDDHLFYFKDDIGEIQVAEWKECEFLGGADWIKTTSPLSVYWRGNCLYCGRVKVAYVGRTIHDYNLYKVTMLLTGSVYESTDLREVKEIAWKRFHDFLNKLMDEEEYPSDG